MKNWLTKLPMFLFIINLENQPNLTDIYKIKDVIIVYWKLIFTMVTM